MPETRLMWIRRKKKVINNNLLSSCPPLPPKHIQSYYFDRDDVALPGFAKYFKKAADEEKEHAELLMKFQVQRGGRIVLSDIKKPIKDEWGSGLDAMQDALALEKSMNQSLLELHKTVNEHNDYQVNTVT